MQLLALHSIFQLIKLIKLVNFMSLSIYLQQYVDWLMWLGVSMSWGITLVYTLQT